MQMPNTIMVSSKVNWKDFQHILLELQISAHEYEVLKSLTMKEWTASCGFVSTVHSNAWVTLNLTHKLIPSRMADTSVLIEYPKHPDKTIDARSVWYLDKESDDVFNLTGNLHLYSPLASYRKSELKCQLRLMTNWQFFGAANLDLDKRKYTGHLIGDLVRWKESKIEFNVITPLEKFAYVRGRFGLSESNRHAVAEIVTPSGPLGVEMLCQLFTSAYDFNIKLMLATPIDVLQKALAVAKLSTREADFRIAYNNLTAGFLGTWHYRNITDFDYSYIVFTPLEGLQECGVTARLIVIPHPKLTGMLDVNTEFSLKLADIKFGIKAKGGPKLPPVKIPMKTPIIMPTMDYPDGLEEEAEDDEEDDDDDDDDNLYWRGELQVTLMIRKFNREALHA